MHLSVILLFVKTYNWIQKNMYKDIIWLGNFMIYHWWRTILFFIYYLNIYIFKFCLGSKNMTFCMNIKF